jgi:hypothetical protein
VCEKIVYEYLIYMSKVVKIVIQLVKSYDFKSQHRLDVLNRS